MARHGSLSDCIPVPISIEISDVFTVPSAAHGLSLNNAMQRLLKDLLELDEVLVAQTKLRNKVLGQGCKQASRAFHEVRCSLNDVLGGEPATAE